MGGQKMVFGQKLLDLKYNFMIFRFFIFLVGFIFNINEWTGYCEASSETNLNTKRIYTLYITLAIISIFGIYYFFTGETNTIIAATSTAAITIIPNNITSDLLPVTLNEEFLRTHILHGNNIKEVLLSNPRIFSFIITHYFNNEHLYQPIFRHFLSQFYPNVNPSIATVEQQAEFILFTAEFFRYYKVPEFKEVLIKFICESQGFKH